MRGLLNIPRDLLSVEILKENHSVLEILWFGIWIFLLRYSVHPYETQFCCRGSVQRSFYISFSLYALLMSAVYVCEVEFGVFSSISKMLQSFCLKFCVDFRDKRYPKSVINVFLSKL